MTGIKLRNNVIDTVILGTVYPTLGSHLNKFLDSLEAQTTRQFDVLLANDGFDNIEAKLSQYSFPHQVLNVNADIATNRRLLIQAAIDLDYRKVIFCDCDDELAINRIEVVSGLLDKSPIVVNDIDTINSEGATQQRHYFSSRFKDNAIITANTLKHGNLMGFTNTAIRAENLQGCKALITGEPIAFDWYLWTSLLMGELNALFTSGTTTKYRVYEDNTAGLPQSLSVENVTKGILVKQQHYELMSYIDNDYSRLSTEFDALYKSIDDARWRSRYMRAIKNYKLKDHMWWENIRPCSEVAIK